MRFLLCRLTLFFYESDPDRDVAASCLACLLSEACNQHEGREAEQAPGAQHPDAPPATDAAAEGFFAAAAHHKQAGVLRCMELQRAIAVAAFGH